MLQLILRLFALRPLLSLAIFGIPVLTLLAIGVATVLAFKLLVFVLLPVAVLLWLLRRRST